jgi:hypothetical protein
VPSLFLHAADPLWRPGSIGGLAERLRELGLTGVQVTSRDAHEHAAGERFLVLVMFLGCSPRVNVDPESGKDEGAPILIRLLLPDAVMFRSAGAGAIVRCPDCRATADPPEPKTFDSRYRCPGCAEEFRLHQLDWRHTAGFASCFIEIAAIHPHEAVPSDKLLDALKRFSACEWRYFYC